jgi:hypothetical protein
VRNIAVSLTKEQILAQTKIVTRRMGWLWLVEACADGEQPFLQPVEKCMGLKRGEKIVRVGLPIRVLGARREPLRALLDDVDYGLNEVAREGFSSHPDGLRCGCRGSAPRTGAALQKLKSRASSLNTRSLFFPNELQTI